MKKAVFDALYCLTTDVFCSEKKYELFEVAFMGLQKKTVCHIDRLIDGSGTQD